MNNCLFCRIIEGTLPTTIIYEDDQVLALEDINPQAPTHFLIIPKQHIATLNDINENNAPLIGHILYVAKQLAAAHGYAESGYRVVMNCNQDGGQTVFHIHCHLLGGRSLSWPPG